MDINCDMGESRDFLDSGHDASLMPYISSVNIACGYHAGSEYIMKKTVENALKLGLKIGAHPGFADFEEFGRREIVLSNDEIKSLILRQLEVLTKISEAFGVKLNHIKPHGALYNMSAKKVDYARSIAEAVFSFDKSLILYGLSGSLSTQESKKIGLQTYEECFADRTYRADGSLSNRKEPNAVKSDLYEVKKQAHALAHGLEIISSEGYPLKLKCDSICIHSDTPNALTFAKAIAEVIL